MKPTIHKVYFLSDQTEPVKEDKSKPNPNWVTPKHGEVVGCGFDDHSTYLDIYDAHSKCIVRKYKKQVQP